MASKTTKRKKIGKYILGEKLGEGTFSVVRAAEDINTHEMWAVKVIEIAKIEAESMEEQLKREIAISKKMKHPNVVQMREVFKTRHHINIVLEFVRGGELFDRIVQARYFPEKVARHYFQQLILGLDYCHSQGVAHRDLKPENLLLDSNDNLKIMDFGLSALQQDKLLKTTCGTPNYVAPEVLTERGYDGFIADIWSCGVILYVMLAGKLPFEDRNMRGLFDKIQRAQYTFPSHFSEGAKILIAKMLVVDPKKRATIAEVIEDPWFQVDFSPVTGETVTTPTTDDFENVFDEAEVEGSSEVQGDATASEPMNAFDLASRLMAGKLTPLMAGGPPVRTSTKIMVSCGVADTLHRLGEFFKSSRISFKIKEGSNVVKCDRTSPRLLTFSCHVIPTVSLRLSMVDVRRGKGDRLEFNDVYREMVHALGELTGEATSAGASR